MAQRGRLATPHATPHLTLRFTNDGGKPLSACEECPGGCCKHPDVEIVEKKGDDVEAVYRGKGGRFDTTHTPDHGRPHAGPTSTSEQLEPEQQILAIIASPNKLLGGDGGDVSVSVVALSCVVCVWVSM